MRQLCLPIEVSPKEWVTALSCRFPMAPRVSTQAFGPHARLVSAAGDDPLSERCGAAPQTLRFSSLNLPPRVFLLFPRIALVLCRVDRDW
jgi:hypothetical protein